MTEPVHRIRLGTFSISEADLAKAEKQMEFARNRDESLTKVRRDRVERLMDRVERSAIDKALTGYSKFSIDDVAAIHLRPGFIELPVPRPRRDPDVRYDRAKDLATRPPLTKLVNRAGNTLQVYLTMLFIAQLETPMGAYPSNTRPNSYADGWAALAGLKSSTPRLSNRRFGRTVGRLVEQDLVEAHVTGVKGQYDRFKIRKEDGSGEPYLVPTGGRLVSVPVEFFLRGWHLVLTPNEIATYLVILNHKTRVGPRTDGVAVPELVRDTVYGLSAEAYLSAHELAEFGLIDIREPDTEDTTGTKDTEGGSPAGDAGDHKRLPHRFIFPPKGGHDFSRPAADVVLERLTSNSLPPRI
ncbi:MAG: hypothetical protein ACRDTW_04960 [Rhodococcus qingshengii]